MKYTAHIRESDRTEQSVESHCRQTAMLAAQYGKSVGLEKTAEVAGYLHDMGKFSAAFNAYIHKGGHSDHEKINHSFAGAKYLKELLQDSEDASLQKNVSLIGRVILAHHGLHDWMNEEQKDTYQFRTEKDPYDSEIRSNFEASELSDGLDQKLPADVQAVSVLCLWRIS